MPEKQLEAEGKKNDREFFWEFGKMLKTEK